MPSYRPREELAAIVIAPVLVGLALFAFARREGAAPEDGMATAPPRLESPIPVSAKLDSGELPNRLRYYIRANGWPEGRAELRLVVNAGAVLEAADQRGLAHAVEHMLFRGTKRFPGHAVDEYLASIGMRPGYDVNATTTQDETVINITVPTDRAGALDTAVAILADMAHNATFDPAEARQEAGVVMSEWRSGVDARQRLRDERNTVLLAGSPYAGHPVIGDTAVLRRFDVGAMRRFYSDWYRPDLMAVVAVGDFDAGAVERMVQRHFRELPAARSPRPRPRIDVPRPATPRAITLHDAEATTSRVVLWHLTASRSPHLISEYRETLVDELWRRVLRERLDDASERPGSPLLGMQVSTTTITRPLDADRAEVRVRRGSELAALDMLVTEVARLATFGVTDADVRSLTAAMLRERRGADEWSDNSATLAEGLVDEFLTGSTPVDRASAYELARQLLPTITAKDVLSRSRSLSVDSGAVVVVTAPQSAGIAVADAELIARARSAGARATPLVADSVALAEQVALVPHPPAPGQVSSETVVADARVFDWRLSNGVRVILKPTRFSYDDIELRAFAAGGASLASDADYPSAYLADGVISSTGVGPLNGRMLARRLDATSVSLTPSVRDDRIELSGSAKPNDLRLLFQLLNLYFTAPRTDSVAFRRYRERMVEYSRGRRADPDAIFIDSVAAITTQGHTRSRQDEESFVDALSMTKALDFWKARTANASGLTVVMVGDFTLDQVRPLIARYVASLPAGTPEHARDAGMRFPRGAIRRQIVAGMGPKARTQLVFSGPYQGTAEESERLGAAVDVAELALTALLRERLGGTYDVGVESDVSLAPPSRYTITVDFETSPERADSLASAALGELARLHDSGPTDREATKVRAARTRDLDGKLRNNDYWASELTWHARMGWSLGAINNHQDEAKLLSSADLRLACSTYLRSGEYVQVTMYPARRD